MEKSEVTLIINDYFDSLLSLVNSEVDLQKLNAKTEENFDEIKETIDADRDAFEQEINKSREANIQQLDSDPDLLQSLNAENLKDKIFDKSFCVFFPKQYVPRFYGTNIGFLMKSYFYIDENTIKSIQ